MLIIKYIYAMNLKHVITVFTISLLVFNCSSGSDDPEPEPIPDPIPSTVTYDDHVKPIMTSNCTRCHGTSPTNGAPTSYTTFSEVKAGVEGNIIIRINSSSNPMPPTGRMSTRNREIIQKWKDQGFLEN